MDDWVRQLMDGMGVAGVALLMFLENLFPPIPSEVIMPLAGFAAGRGEYPLAVVLAAGTAGALAGALFWYMVAQRLGEDGLRRFAERHGRWITMTPDDLDRVQGWFRRHQHWAVPLGHLVPGVRTFVSVPAGLFGMKLARFIALTMLGAGAWTSVLGLAGYLLGRQAAQVERWLGPVSTGVMAAILLWYLYRVATFRRA